MNSKIIVIAVFAALLGLANLPAEALVPGFSLERAPKSELPGLALPSGQRIYSMPRPPGYGTRERVMELTADELDRLFLRHRFETARALKLQDPQLNVAMKVVSGPVASGSKAVDRRFLVLESDGREFLVSEGAFDNARLFTSAELPGIVLVRVGQQTAYQWVLINPQAF